jgi:hypothetical protein
MPEHLTPPKAEKAAPLPLKRYKVLAGSHVEKDVLYREGEVFESTQDILALNGPVGMSPKFEAVN